MRKSFTAFSALVVCAFIAGSADASAPVAQLKNVEGKVYINKGKGFTPASGSVELFQGDRVMVGENGSAAIDYYLAGCDVMLVSSSMTTISDKAPCKNGSATSTHGLLFSGGGASIGVAVPVVGVAGFLALGTVVATGENKRDPGQSP